MGGSGPGVSILAWSKGRTSRGLLFTKGPDSGFGRPGSVSRVAPGPLCRRSSRQPSACGLSPLSAFSVRRPVLVGTSRFWFDLLSVRINVYTSTPRLGSQKCAEDMSLPKPCSPGSPLWQHSIAQAVTSWSICSRLSQNKAGGLLRRSPLHSPPAPALPPPAFTIEGLFPCRSFFI